MRHIWWLSVHWSIPCTYLMCAILGGCLGMATNFHDLYYCYVRVRHCPAVFSNETFRYSLDILLEGRWEKLCRLSRATDPDFCFLTYSPLPKNFGTMSGDQCMSESCMSELQRCWFFDSAGVAHSQARFPSISNLKLRVHHQTRECYWLLLALSKKANKHISQKCRTVPLNQQPPSRKDERCVHHS